jgi:DNA polymerase
MKFSLDDQGHARIFFGTGNPNAHILCVCEIPGLDADGQTQPLVGRADELLTRIVESGMKMSREDLYIINVARCRPQKNVDEAPENLEKAYPFIQKQIEIVKPRVIMALGRVALQAIFEKPDSITRSRGQWREIDGYPVMPTFHPAYLLRNPAGKKEVWQDIKTVLRYLQAEP